MPRPKPDIEPAQIAVRLSPSLLAELDAWCRAAGRVRNGVVAEAIEHYIRRGTDASAPVPTKPMTSPLAPRGGKLNVPERLTLSDVRPKFEPRLKPDKGAKK